MHKGNADQHEGKPELSIDLVIPFALYFFCLALHLCDPRVDGHGTANFGIGDGNVFHKNNKTE